MAALIDLEALDTQSLPGPHLSQDTLATMALLSEALELTDMGSHVRPATLGIALESQHANINVSYSANASSQYITHRAAVDPEPAISARSSATVIADLKIGRHQRQKIHLNSPVEITSNTYQENTSSKPEQSQLRGNDDEVETVESEPEEENCAPKKARKISERKRIQNAAHESWFLSYQRQQAKIASNVSGVVSEALSVKHLVRQAESQRIISSPREYQVELFERAKEENIIAVLDTGKVNPFLIQFDYPMLTCRLGSGKTLIAVLLLQHIIKQELEDRALGKPKRVAFFLVCQL